jgi:hypothetical protein
MIRNLLLAVAAFICFAGLFSCKHKTPLPAPENISGKMNFALLRYDSTELEYRLDSIHNRGLALQLCLVDAGNNNTDFQLISYAFDTLGDHNNSWMPDTLRAISDSVRRNFDGPVVVGNTEVTREQLYDVLNKPDGKRVSYDYMLFTPVLEGVFHHIVYRIQPIKNGKPAEGNSGKMQMTTPMPPSRVW